jgi:hypothetical protein
MATIITLDDASHCEYQGQFLSVPDAFEEIKARAVLPWDQPPNRCPCTAWKTCDRLYQILVYDDSTTPWTLQAKLGNLQISNRGVVWSGDFENGCLPDSAQ